MYRTNAYEEIKIEKSPMKLLMLALKALKLIGISLLGLIAVIIAVPGFYYAGKILAFHADGRPALAVLESRFDPMYWFIGAFMCVPLFFSYHIGKKIVSQFT